MFQVDTVVKQIVLRIIVNYCTMKYILCAVQKYKINSVILLSRLIFD